MPRMMVTLGVDYHIYISPIPPEKTTAISYKIVFTFYNVLALFL